MAESKFISIAEEILRKETNQKKITTYHFLRPDTNHINELDNLKEFLQKPSGVLITDAEAFNGMQARNIVIVGSRSPNVRYGMQHEKLSF